MSTIKTFKLGIATAALTLGLYGCGGDDASYLVVGDIEVSSRVQGVAYRPGQPGTYRFTITGGAYTLGNGLWMTAINVYSDRPVQTDPSTGRPNPTNPDAVVGDYGLQSDKALAEQIGQGKEAAVSISEYAILIVPDDLGTFSDNNGSVRLLIEREQ